MKVAFYTLGCKVNQYETYLMIQSFKDKNYDIVDFDEKADVYVINSCSVTNMSDRKTRQYLSRAKRQGAIVVLCGCYAEEIKDSIDIKNVNIVLGNEDKKNIVYYVEEYIKSNKKELVYKISDISNVKKYSQKENLKEGLNIRGNVKIEDGCNNFCSYCIIPYLRGRVRSRDINAIIDETYFLVKSGVVEIVLVGIEIASYGNDLEEKISLIDVVEKISQIKEVKRIRLGSLEPRILTEENIVRLSKIKKLCNHFHISVQNLDSAVLKRMNRKYDADFLIKRIQLLRKYFKDPGITCDIIVGFPGESEEEFSNTYNAVKNIKFSDMHVFKYSKRKFTLASKMENQIDGSIKNKRSEALIYLGSKNRLEYINKYIGTKQKVLFESFDEDGYVYGYTSNYLKVKVRGDKNLCQKILEVELVSIEKDLILGRL